MQLVIEDERGKIDRNQRNIPKQSSRDLMCITNIPRDSTTTFLCIHCFYQLLIIVIDAAKNFVSKSYFYRVMSSVMTSFKIYFES